MKTGVTNFNTEDIDDVQITTKYCVDSSTHDMHVRHACALGLPPVPVVKPDFVQDHPIAIVCSGPSLKDTWEEIKPFKTVLTCSGAHDYLIERGIIPTYHMETDPRPHKAVFTRSPNLDVHYFIASNCHPDVFENLREQKVFLWHVSDPQLHKFPRGHWCLTGGCNVGLRAMVMARLLGFHDVHIFGMDCSAEGKKFHVNFHPNEPKPKGHRVVKVGRRKFNSSDVFIECARQFFKETMLLSDVRTTLHGDGFLQALAIRKMSDPKEIERRKAWILEHGGITIATSLPVTISAQYAELNKKLHEENRHYGGHGDRYAKIVQKMSETEGVKTVLDYGCGKGALAKALNFPIWEYDPAIPEKSATPQPADLVICTDVLEHIEPEYLDAVLEDLRRVIKFSAFFAIHTGPSCKVLADGRNTHLIQQNMDWWKQKLSNYFDVPYCQMQNNSPVLSVVCGVKRGLKQAA